MGWLKHSFFSFTILIICKCIYIISNFYRFGHQSIIGIVRATKQFDIRLQDAQESSMLSSISGLSSIVPASFNKYIQFLYSNARPF